MLDPFPVAVEIGGRYAVICRDVETAAFFYGAPNALPTMACYERLSWTERLETWIRLKDWMLGLLPRVAVAPALTPEIVARLADASLDLVVGYLHAVGWITWADVERQSEAGGEFGAAAQRYRRLLGEFAAEPLPVGLPASPPLYGARHLPLIAEVAPNIRTMIRMVAQRAHVRPSRLWAGPISEFVFDWRTLVAEDPAGGAGDAIPEEILAAGTD